MVELRVQAPAGSSAVWRCVVAGWSSCAAVSAARLYDGRPSDHCALGSVLGRWRLHTDTTRVSHGRRSTKVSVDLYSALYRLISNVWHVLTRDHTVLPVTHTAFIHKWNEPYLPLLPSRRASPQFGWYSFPVPLRVGDWVGEILSWFIRRRRTVTLLIRPTMLQLRHGATLMSSHAW